MPIERNFHEYATVNKKENGAFQELVYDDKNSQNSQIAQVYCIMLY